MEPLVEDALEVADGTMLGRRIAGPAVLDTGTGGVDGAVQEAMVKPTATRAKTVLARMLVEGSVTGHARQNRSG